jgi:uncharacterized lipoprotein YddW (UPF0748 family)
MKFLLFLVCLLGIGLQGVSAQTWKPGGEKVPEPPREFRGAWIASVHNYDWPSSAGLSAASQKAELVALLDKAVATGLNAVLLQVRPACDALYQSSLEPWSAFLTGSMGTSPGYDPLAFAITEAHRRGLELHAWINPFRASAGGKSKSAKHVTRTHPEWIRSYGGQQWLDPGIPEARAHSMRVVADIVSRYDLDGFHIDDYFYPYPNRDAAGAAIPFGDQQSYARYGGGAGLLDWRRANIDTFVEQMYATVKKYRPAAKVGISPFGIWQPGYPRGIEARLNAYTELAADSRKWLKRGWCDYFMPQLYWRIDPPEQSFSELLAWWLQQSGGNRHVWPGIATERIQSSADPGRPAQEILRQVDLAQRTSTGHCHWSMKALKQNRSGITPALANGPYAQRKALVPACPWLGNSAPAAPVIAVQTTKAGSTVTWQPNRATRWWAVQVKDPKGNWYLIGILPMFQQQFLLPPDIRGLAVRAVSATGIGSAPAVLVLP